MPLPHRLPWLPALLILPLLACSDKDGDDDDGCDSNSTMERDTNTLISDYREDNGLGPLELDACASEVARVHSQDMADGTEPFSHNNFDQRADDIFTMFTGVIAVGENVAYMSAGYPDPAYTAYDGWLNSPDHYDNIITPDFNRSGMAVVEGDDGSFWFTHLLIAIDE